MRGLIDEILGLGVIAGLLWSQWLVRRRLDRIERWITHDRWMARK